MRRVFVLRAAAIGAILAGAALKLYAHSGWRDAARNAGLHKTEAQRLIALGLDGNSLGAERLKALLLVEDPAFLTHNGVDWRTPGAGQTTITQALSKRIAFKNFRKGLPKIRQTAFALSLERHLSKEEILALALDRAPMGPAPGQTGMGIIGFHRASAAHFSASPSAITEDQYLSLVAVLIAPDALSLSRPNAKRDERVRRIKRLIAGKCAPTNHGDVWLEGCS